MNPFIPLFMLIVIFWMAFSVQQMYKIHHKELQLEVRYEVDRYLNELARQEVKE